MTEVLQSQDGLWVQLNSAFIKDEVVIQSLRGKEAISELFEYNLVFSSSNGELDGEGILGTVATISIKSDEHERFINGIVTKFSQGNTALKEDIYLTEYSMTINPKLWLLSLDKNCKMFQKKSTIDIIKSVLSDNKIKDVSDKTTQRGKDIREYCVQYNESSFNFISRLMEDEGIFYYFIHENGKHTLVLSDNPNSYSEISKKSEVEFIKNRGEQYPLGKIFSANIDTAMNVGGYSLADYNYSISQTKLFNKLTSKWKDGMFYEYPGGFEKTNQGEALSKIRVQEIETNNLVLRGRSTVPAFTPGSVFSLKLHHSENFNGSYVLYKVEHFFDKSESRGLIYQNSFVAFKKGEEFRAPRKTPKPKVFGNQTAIVVCPQGKEIYRNEHCCVKVHFHWDQDGKSKDTDDSSCWIRVAQLLSGSNWGAIFIPRVGQEVVVSFIEGDPDRPLIIGCVYNDHYMPPYPEAEDTKTTLKTVTFTDDNGFNEIRFNDDKDKEEIYVHAQKDVYVDIVNSRKTEIEESDDSLSILKGSRSTTLLAKGDGKGNYSLEMKKGDKSVTIDEGDSVVQLKKGDSKITLDKGDRVIKLGNGNQKVDVKGDYTLKISGNLKIDVDGDISIKAGKNIKSESGMDYSNKAGMNYSSKAGMDMKLEASMNLNAKANMNVDIKGTMMFSAQGMVSAKVKGTIVELAANASSMLNAPINQIKGVLKIG